MDIQVIAVDGFPLAVTHFVPSPDKAVGKTVVISPDTGTRRMHYDAFAEFLRESGFRVLTFDYRGIGGSLPNDVKSSPACMAEWGSKDLSALINWAISQNPDHSLYVIGHSVGGQILGLAENCTRIRGMVLIACSHGYWKNSGFLGRSLFGPAWYLLFPILTKILRYLPSSRLLGIRENLPAGVAREWGAWAKNKDYLFANHPYAKARIRDLKIPVLAYSFKDDYLAPAISVKMLLDIFPNASKQWNHISPRDLKIKSIGHFGYFKTKLKSTLWADTRDWLNGC